MIHQKIKLSYLRIPWRKHIDAHDIVRLDLQLPKDGHVFVHKVSVCCSIGEQLLKGLLRRLLFLLTLLAQLALGLLLGTQLCIIARNKHQAYLHDDISTLYMY